MTSPRPVVIVVGAGGQLGQAVAARFAAAADVQALPREALDITDAAAVADRFARSRPAAVINCAAFNDVDGAQQRQAEALAVNGVAVGILARAAESAGAVFVHYSTDFVFAGRENRVWTEDDDPEPQSVYAQSKLVGEWLARDAARRYVLRVESLFGGRLGRSTIDRIVGALREGRSMPVFHDRTVTPSFVDDVAEATWRLIDAGAPFGLYHCVNSGVATWLDIGAHVAGRLALDAALLRPVAMADVRMAVSRPQYAALDNARLARAGIAMPAWQDAIDRYLARPPS